MIGKMKDEVKGKINNELVGLKPNIYYLAIVNNEEIEKAKGAIKILLKTDEKYDDVLFSKYLIGHKMKRIQTKQHRIRT